MKLKDYTEQLRYTGCYVCRTSFSVELHHVRSGSVAKHGIIVGKSEKASDWLQIPLCTDHHVGNRGIHKIGVLTWEKKNGTQLSALRNFSEFFGINVFEKAGYKYDSELDRYYKSENDR